MIFVILMFFTALVLSAIAGFYSIAGLIAIFSAAPIPIAVMGASLELAKLVTASWLYRNWKNAPKLLKYYFIAGVSVLMMITSLGIFGYLSKAHSDQTLVSGDAQSKVAIYDEKIKIAKENIDVNRKALKQMDEAVDQSMARSNDEKGADKAIAIRKGQQKERQRIQSEIADEQKRIAQLSADRAPIALEVRKVEAEVGPIKYIASFIYGSADSVLLERAVTWIIILIICVFDPMAVLLLIAANYSLQRIKGEPVNMTSVDPVALDKEELINATKLYHRDQDSM